MSDETRIAELEEEVANLEYELTDTTAMYDELREENKRLNEELTELERQMGVAEDLAYRAYTTLAR